MSDDILNVNYIDNGLVRGGLMIVADRYAKEAVGKYFWIYMSNSMDINDFDVRKTYKLFYDRKIKRLEKSFGVKI